MKRLHSIIYQETIAPALITLLILTFVVFTREFGRLAELLIRKNATLTTILKAVVYLMPSILVFTIPFAFLIGTLIGFSRLSTDSEIIAMRAGGVSVFQMLWPVLKIGFLVVLISGSFTLFLLPLGNWELRLLRHEIREAPVQSQIKPRVFYEEFPGILIYVQDIDLRSMSWEGIFVADSTSQEEERLILADRGVSVIDPDSRRLQLHFEQGTIYSTPKDAPEKVTISRFGTLDIPIDLQVGSVGVEREKRGQDRTIEEILEDLRVATPEVAHDSLVELNRRLALPLSAIIFSILSVTLGSRTPRGGRGYGFILSIVVAFSYYILFATGSTLSKSGVLPIPVGVWGANMILGAIALLTLRKANRESALLQRFSGWHVLSWVPDQLVRVCRSIKDSLNNLLKRARNRIWIRLPKIRLRLARVIDLYMVRIFLAYFLVTLGICIALVCLFTFFEIIDNVFENGITYSVVVEYFIFLQPHLLMLLVPISILIATLVTFGSLEKSNQIVALKSCGISIYRIAVPIFVLGILVSSFIFVMQEHILPYANQRQDNLRNVIKGMPIQTTQPGLNWIFGGGNRLYNYDFFSSKGDSFGRLSLYRLDIGSDGLAEQVFAQKATWDRTSQQWILSNGWVRDYGNGSFRSFEEEFFPFPETPSYFDQGIRESSKMTYLELEHYITDLQTGGFEVDYLKTELYKKVSFPIVSLIMTAIGLPFALTMGRKGALYGIAIGVFIGIVYWGAFGVFDVLGSNGLLAPALAAWGPNIVFGIGAVTALSVVKT
ncbi:MAG: LPS export ABC transporter permease LptF [Acidobacteriota bacterium]|nr:MAG: LPS export ABC transporter permease LptF [Acidobacteriota bacterium]